MDDGNYGRAVDRIIRFTLVLGGIGAVVAAIVGGLPAAGGFLLGAGISYLNFRWLKRLVDSFGRTAISGRTPGAKVAVFLGLRYVFLGAGAYVILRSSVVSLPAALAGLFVAVAAVILEILFELVYAP
jgi:hypothetical protein